VSCLADNDRGVRPSEAERVDQRRWHRLLPRDVRAFEPRLALDGGADGTDLLAEVARRSPRWLRPGGWLLLELGGDQAEPMGRLIREAGFEEADVMIDDDGDARAVAARLGTDAQRLR